MWCACLKHCRVNESLHAKKKLRGFESMKNVTLCTLLRKEIDQEQLGV